MSAQVPHIISCPPTLIPYRTAHGTMPAPPRMDPPPHRADLAYDAAVAIPAGVGAESWLIFDASGMCRGGLWFPGGKPVTREELKVMALFERNRHRAGDRLHFEEDRFAERMQQAAAAPDAGCRFLFATYTPLLCDSEGVAVVNPDATRTVEVAVLGALVQTVVLDSQGQVVDACSSWDEDEKPTQEMRDLCDEFWSRRAAVADACVMDPFDGLLEHLPPVRGNR